MKAIKSLFAVCLILISAFAASCSGNNEFTGNRIKNPDYYLLDIEFMTGTDEYTLTLKGGDMLSVEFVTTEGSLKTEIKDSDGEIVYSGNGKEANTFTVNVKKDGEYVIRVEANKAKGKVEIKKRVSNQAYTLLK